MNRILCTKPSPDVIRQALFTSVNGNSNYYVEKNFRQDLKNESFTKHFYD